MSETLLEQRAAWLNVIREKLVKNTVTQKELSEMLGIHESAVSRWLSTTRANIVTPNVKSLQNMEWAIDRILVKRLKSRAGGTL